MKPKFNIDHDGYLGLDTIDRPKDRREALRWSIAKWKFIMEHPEVTYDGAMDTCGCCLYEFFHDSDCPNCLICKYTGKEECYNTPYVDWDVRPGGASRMYKFLKKVYKSNFGNK